MKKIYFDTKIRDFHLIDTKDIDTMEKCGIVHDFIEYKPTVDLVKLQKVVVKNMKFNSWSFYMVSRNLETGECTIQQLESVHITHLFLAHETESDGEKCLSLVVCAHDENHAYILFHMLENGLAMAENKVETALEYRHFIINEYL